MIGEILAVFAGVLGLVIVLLWRLGCLDRYLNDNSD